MTPRSMLIVAACLSFTSTAFAGTGESSFTPTSLLVPLQSVILLGPGNGGAELYRCPSSTAPALDLDDAGAPVMPEDSCLVDMADNSAASVPDNFRVAVAA